VDLDCQIAGGEDDEGREEAGGGAPGGGPVVALEGSVRACRTFGGAIQFGGAQQQQRRGQQPDPKMQIHAAQDRPPSSSQTHRPAAAQVRRGRAYASVLPLPVGAQMQASCAVLAPPASSRQTAAWTGNSSEKPSSVCDLRVRREEGRGKERSRVPIKK